MRAMLERWIVVALWSLPLASVALLSACGSSGTSTLVTVRSATGSGPIDFSVENGTEVPINNVYLAKSRQVGEAVGASNEAGSTAEAELWGPDLLGAALPTGERVTVPVAEPGEWDLRAVDRDGRYQQVAQLKLGPGGRYILRLTEGSWRVPK